jgi:hypothetical protein
MLLLVVRSRRSRVEDMRAFLRRIGSWASCRRSGSRQR